MTPRTTIATATMAICVTCNLSQPDDGKRFKKFGGKVFICAHCKVRS